METELPGIVDSLTEILKQIGEHPNVAYSFAGFLVLAICSIFFRSGKTPGPLTLTGYIATLVVIVALFVLPSIAAPKVPTFYYYAGSGGHPSNFSVGYFQKTSDDHWTERVLDNVRPGPNDTIITEPNGDEYHYKIVGTENNTLRFQGIDDKRENVIIEFDLEHKRISYIAHETEITLLYDIIVSR